MAVRTASKRSLPGGRSPQTSRYHGVRMTEEQYLSLPEQKPYLEYVDGMAVQKPMANANHGRLVRRLDARLDAYIERHGGDAGPERGIRISSVSAYKLPDAAYWAPGRPNGDDSTPTLAIEVRSPDQTLSSLRGFCRLYRANGVDVCWLIDPEARTVEIFEGDRDAEPVPKGGALLSAFLPDFSLSLSDLFSVLDSGGIAQPQGKPHSNWGPG